MADIVNCFALKSTRENSEINFLSKGVELGQLMDEYMGIPTILPEYNRASILDRDLSQLFVRVQQFEQIFPPKCCPCTSINSAIYADQIECLRE